MITVKTKKTLSATEEQYISPDIKVIDIEISHAILAGSGDLPGMPGEDW
jgi:hypothetical protein